MKNLDEQTYQQIEDYLNNRLDETAKADFEAEMTMDTDLREEVVKLQLLRQIAKREATRNKIKEIQAEKLNQWKAKEVQETIDEALVEEEVSRPKFRIWRSFGTLAAAASIAFLIYLNATPISLPNATTLSERGNSADLDSVQKINFENYLTAQNALKQGENETAVEYFEKVRTATEIRPYYKDASTWFLAVANADKNPEKAEDLMQEIQSKADFKYEISFLDKARMWCKIQWRKLVK